MKLPNGYGSVIKMKGHRRNPYMVRKTAGWHYDKEKDKQVQDYIIIGYARTKAEGLKMLAEYNENPYDAKAAKMTFQDVYDEWSKRKYPAVSHSNVCGYTAAYRVCGILYNRTFVHLKLPDLQQVIDQCGKNYPTMKKIKGLFSQMYEFAIKNDICPKDYSKFVDIAQYRDRNPKKLNRDRIPKKDVDRSWDQHGDPYWNIVIMLIYNGCRISEFLDLKKADVNLDLLLTCFLRAAYSRRLSKSHRVCRRYPGIQKPRKHWASGVLRRPWTCREYLLCYLLEN